MVGFETLAKLSPIFLALAMGFVGYGELKSDIHNVQLIQEANYSQVSNQLDRIYDKLDQKQDKAR